jgi:hypothetical protein
MGGEDGVRDHEFKLYIYASLRGSGFNIGDIRLFIKKKKKKKRKIGLLVFELDRTFWDRQDDTITGLLLIFFIFVGVANCF